MKKDLLIQKMVKIAKAQQILLKKLANFDDLPPDYDKRKELFIKEMNNSIKHYDKRDGRNPTIDTVIGMYTDLEGLAKGNNIEEFAQHFPGWKPDHFKKLLEDLEAAFLGNTSMPDNYEDLVGQFINLMKQKLRFKSIVGSVGDINSVCTHLNMLEKIADGITDPKDCPIVPMQNWKQEHFRILVKRLNKEFNKLTFNILM
jgi:hypothetical protein